MERSYSLAEVMAEIDRVRDSLAAVVVHLNDTYLIDERPEQRLPGFARVTRTINTIRKHVQEALGEDRTLVLHSGDFLAPSRVGKYDKGEVMVKLLNGMKVDYCTLGNHEFDYKDATLRKRLKEAKFKVLLSNVKCAGVDLLPYAEWLRGDRYESAGWRRVFRSLLPYAEWPRVSRPIIALTGVVSQSVYESFDNRAAWKYTPEADALRGFVERAMDAPFLVVLTHAKRAEDRNMRKELRLHFGRRGGLRRRMYFLGGHDHDIYWREEDGPTLLKNLSNLRTIRVVLLLAGGRGIADALISEFSQWERRTARRPRQMEREKDLADAYQRRMEREKDLADAYRTVIKELTGRLHPLDAAVLQRRLQEPPPQSRNDELRRLMRDWGNSEQYAALNDALDKGVMEPAEFPDDVILEMDYDGHGPGDPNAQRLINAAMPKFVDEEAVVADLRGQCTGMLDATDEHLRRSATDFGLLVAECVQREAGADFALLNSGAFRCDAELAPLLRLRDLRNTFLYDSQRAVVVLYMSKAVVEKALAHGRAQTGSGAYLQTSPLTLPPHVERVAIAAYLVDEKGIGDGYGKVIAEALGITLEELWNMTASAPAAFSLEGAVTRWAQKVGYRAVTVAEVDEDTIGKFVTIADKMFAEKLVKYDSVDWLQDMWTDKPLEDKVLQELRDNLRKLIRALPEVSALEAARKVPKSQQPDAVESDPLEEAREAMLRMHDQLGGCPQAFQTGRNYAFLFSHVAHGIATWQA